MRLDTSDMTLYHCPDCDRIHDEPFEAAYSLMARCVDCSLEHLVRAVPGSYAKLPDTAAA